MGTQVTTRLIKIGNSHGFRIPKLLLDQVGLTGEVQIEAQSGQLVIRSVQASRQGWDSQFQAMAKAGDDHLLDDKLLALNSWEASEWEW